MKTVGVAVLLVAWTVILTSVLNLAYEAIRARLDAWCHKKLDECMTAMVLLEKGSLWKMGVVDQRRRTVWKPQWWNRRRSSFLNRSV